MYAKSITKDEINLLPVKKFEGEIVLVDTIERVKQAVHLLSNQRVLGFDTETRPSFMKGRSNSVALLQLSTSDKAFLFRINKIGLPFGVTKILSNSKIIKVGVAIRDDIKILKKMTPFMPESFLDLQNYVKRYEIADSGLQKLSAIVLGFKISKAQQLSNWENSLLTQAQMQYAATDAWVCHEIYSKLAHSEPQHLTKESFVEIDEN